MIKRSALNCLEDILQYSRQLLKFSENLTQTEFEKNLEKQYALIRCLEVIGEATKRLGKADPSISKLYPDIEWKAIAGMRDILIHHYEEANMDRIWGTIQKDVPVLTAKIEHILKEHIQS